MGEIKNRQERIFFLGMGVWLGKDNGRRGELLSQQEKQKRVEL